MSNPRFVASITTDTRTFSTKPYTLSKLLNRCKGYADVTAIVIVREDDTATNDAGTSPGGLTL